MLDVSYEMAQVIDEEGRLLEDRNVGLSDEELRRLYKTMLTARGFDERAVRLQRQGRLNTYPQFTGQEAVQVGAAGALEEGDFFFPYYRDSGACLALGVSLKDLFLYWRGHMDGFPKPEGAGGGVNVVPLAILIAAQVPQAAGVAWASKLKGDGCVTLCSFGDGATSKGDFHEGLNFAAVNKAPLVALCHNNHWAISVPLSRQTASPTIAQKAVAYDMPGVRVDGGDALAVREAVEEAVRRARDGEGPTLIEAVTYRTAPHATSDDPSRYQTPEDLKRWSRTDPLSRFRAFLEKRNSWNGEEEERAAAGIKEELSVAFKEAEAAGESRVEQVFGRVYAGPTPDLIGQQRSALSEGGR